MLSRGNEYQGDQTIHKLHSSNINDKCSKQSLVALKAYYHDVTLAFVKDNALQILKYTELTQSLSSFLIYLLTNYKKDNENTKKKYIPLRDAMRIYCIKYDFTIHDYGNCIILQKQKESMDEDVIMLDNTRYDGYSENDNNDVLVVNYKDILHQTTTVTKRFRANIQNNCHINKQKMIQDLKKSLLVPVKSDKAMKMMLNMGWDGGSLGTRGDGIIEPIMPPLDLKAGAGLGHLKQADVKKSPSKHTLIISILEDFLDFLKSNDTSTELICPKKLSNKDRGFITNLINMINIKRRVEVDDKERGLLLNQIYEVSLVKNSYVTGFMDGQSRIKFTKTPIIRPLDLDESKLNAPLTSYARHVTSLPSPIVNLGQGPIRYATASFLHSLNYRYVTPFSPLNINKQSLNQLVFRTATLIFILDFDKSQLDRIEVKFEKLLNNKERCFVIEAVEMINKGHNKNGGRTKVENHLLKEILGRKKTYCLSAGFGNCNTSFTLEKVLNRYEASPKKINLIARNNRNKMNANNDYINEIFRSIDNAFPPLMCVQTNDLSRDKSNDNNQYVDNYSDTNLYTDNQTLAENVKYVTESCKPNNITIVKNVHSNDHRKIYIDKNINGASPYITNDSKSCENLRSNSQNSLSNRFVKSSSSSFQVLTATSNSTNDNIDDRSKIIDKSDYENVPNSNNSDDNISVIDMTIWTSDDEDFDIDDLLNEDVSHAQNNKTSSKMESPIPLNTDEFATDNEKDAKNKKIVINEDEIDKVIEDSVKRMDLKENDDSCRKRRLGSGSDSSDLMIFKKYKTLDRITYVNLTPKNPSVTVSDVDFVKNVQTVISLMLDITNELPLLKCHGYRNGALVYSCHNENSLTWLQMNCVATSDIVVTVTEEVLFESIKMSLKMNCYIDENYKKIIQRLEMYNKGLSTNQWVWLKEEKFTDYIIITFKIDELSFNYIQGKNFRLFVGIDEAQFSVVWN